MKFYIIPAISFIFAFLYFMPWVGHSYESLGFYVWAVFWFLVAWIPMVVHLVFAVKNRMKKEEKRPVQNHLVAAGMILFSYLIVGIGISQGYFVTV
jgi:hypothetical protein